MYVQLTAQLHPASVTLNDSIVTLLYILYYNDLHLIFPLQYHNSQCYISCISNLTYVVEFFVCLTVSEKLAFALHVLYQTSL